MTFTARSSLVAAAALLAVMSFVHQVEGSGLRNSEAVADVADELAKLNALGHDIASFKSDTQFHRNNAMQQLENIDLADDLMQWKVNTEEARERVKEELAKLEAAHQAAHELAASHNEARLRVSEELVRLEAMHNGGAPQRSNSLNIRSPAFAADDSQMKAETASAREGATHDFATSDGADNPEQLKADSEAARQRVQGELAKLEASRQAATELAASHRDARQRVASELAKLEAMHKKSAPAQRGALNLKQDKRPRESCWMKMFGRSMSAGETAQEAVNLVQAGATLLSRSKRSRRHEEL